MSARNALGRDGEDAAAEFLVARGWRILDRNVRSGRTGEIDLVAARDGVLAFVEVKTRRTGRYGTPGEAVTWRKQARIRDLARRYLAERRPGAVSIRFDVVEVHADGPRLEIRHIEGAF